MSRATQTRAVLLECMFTAALPATPALADAVWYVDRDATELSTDGSDWCHAFLALDEALNVAGPGDEIRVANGRYTPDRTGLADPRQASFRLANGVTLLGGYAGCAAPDPDARDVSLYETVLSGDLNGDDLLLTADSQCASGGGTWYEVLCDKVLNNDENSYHVVVSLGNDATAVLDGFTISDGNADGPGFGPSPDSMEQGSGINIYYGTPTIRHCMIKNNRTDNHGALNDHGGAKITDSEFRANFATNWGGALHNHIDISTTISGCIFINNATAGASGGGGAMFTRGAATVANCLFEGNFSAWQGGGCYFGEGSTANLSACVYRENRSGLDGGAFYSKDCVVHLSQTQFLNNDGWRGGAAWLYRGTDATLVDCLFQGNQSILGGGAIGNFSDSRLSVDQCTFSNNFAGSLGGAVLIYPSAPSFTRTVFAGNQSVDGGGAVWSTNGSPTFINCRFLRNTTQISGGAFLTNADSNCYPPCLPKLTNCTLTGNFAGWGGGAITAEASPLVLNNCAVVGNESQTVPGAVLVASTDSLAWIANSILWANFGANGGGEMAQFQILDERSSADIAFSDIQGWSGALGGEGNIADDPLFVDAAGADGLFGSADDDLRLRPGSPAIDAGANIEAATGTDLDGLPRFVDDLGTADSGSGSSPIVDMGAFEFHADCNANGISDDLDIASGTSSDGNENGVPDLCETPPPQELVNGPRYLVVQLDLAPSTVPVALRVTPVDRPCPAWHVNESGRLVEYTVLMTPDQWTTVPIHGPAIISAEAYTVDVLSTNGSTLFTVPISTARWGDTAGGFDGTEWAPPDGAVEITDAVACLNRFSNLPGAPPVWLCDLEPQTPDGRINITDIVWIIKAFSGEPYPFARPCD